MAELALLPNGMQQFCDENGVPYLGGTVGMYVPNTLTYKESWVDPDHNASNEDPITLDAAGRCIIWGEGIYRQILKDIHGNEVWDRPTRFTDNSEADVETLYDLPVYIQDFPEVSEEFPRFAVPRALRLPAGLTNSVAKIQNNPAATMTFTLYKNGVSIGTIAFSTAGVPTITFAIAVDFVSGDIFSMIAPAVQDASGSDISMTFVFTVT